MDLLQKLRIDPSEPLWLINAPGACIDLFRNIVVKEKINEKEHVGQLMLFVHNSAELNHYLPLLSPDISPETLFWICYPKKTGAITSDLIGMKAWDIVFQSGYRGQTSVSVDNDWSGMRFTSAPKKKPTLCDLPMEERKVEGIDFINRTVQLPEDALTEINKHAGMAGLFNTLSFTVKKEYVIAITEAKKEATRKSRIAKITEALLLKMHTQKA